MSHLKPIFAVWDHNAEALAKDIKEHGQKARQWRFRNSIPSAYWPRIIAAAKVKGETITMEQFLPAEEAA